MTWARALSSAGMRTAAVAVLAACLCVAGLSRGADRNKPGAPLANASNPGTERPLQFDLTEGQWESLGFAQVTDRVFTSSITTDGRIAIDEGRATPIFSPYAGRIVRLLAQPGEEIARGQTLFTLESADMVQAQNDFIAASSQYNKADSQLTLARTVEQRQQGLYATQAVPLKDWQRAQNDLISAESDLRSAAVSLEAATNRLRILGRTDAEIEEFRTTGRISREISIRSPIAGTVLQRKLGPGQYVAAGSNDPVYMIGDLSTVWLIANVRESDAGRVHAGLPIDFRVLAYGNREFHGTLNYVAATLDAATRRLLVRATIRNDDMALKPEMFAIVTIVFSDPVSSPAVPAAALIHEGEAARAWVVTEGHRVELRNVTCGLVNGTLVQIREGLRPGETVITRGNLFVDRAARS